MIENLQKLQSVLQSQQSLTSKDGSPAKRFNSIKRGLSVTKKELQEGERLSSQGSDKLIPKHCKCVLTVFRVERLEISDAVWAKNGEANKVPGAQRALRFAKAQESEAARIRSVV